MSETGATDAPQPMPKHLPVLDGVRGLAILAVMLYHFNLIQKPANALESVWAGVMSFGWAGVDLFFVLSGYLITSILLRAKSRPHYFRNFWARRVLRIFPLYYLFLIASFVVLPAVTSGMDTGGLFDDDPPARWWFWTYLPNFLFSREGAFVGGRHLAATWSLGVEEQFYLLWPLVVRWLPRRALAVVVGVGVVGALGIRLWMHARDVHWVAIMVLPYCRMDALLIGAGLALYRPLTDLKPNERARRLSLVLAGTGLIGAAIYGASVGHIAQYEAPIFTLGMSLIAVCFGAVLLFARTSEPETKIARALCSAPLRALGKYSYGLYLIHVFVQHVVIGPWFLEPEVLAIFGPRLVAQLVFSLLCTLASFGLAWAVFHGFEKHFLRLKARF